MIEEELMVLSSPNPALRAASGELTRLRDRVADLEKELQGERQRNQGAVSKLGDIQHQVHRYKINVFNMHNALGVQSVGLEIKSDLQLATQLLSALPYVLVTQDIKFMILETFAGKAWPLVVRCPVDHTGICLVTRPPKTKISSLKRYLSVVSHVGIDYFHNLYCKNLPS